MGEIARAQAWQAASSGLASLATTFTNMIPVADKLVGQKQTKLALDEFTKLTQNITAPNGEKTDAATQLFSMLFGYDPTPEQNDLDKNGVGLMQDLLDLSEDAVKSKDTEGFQAGLGVIKSDIDQVVKKMQAAKQPQTKAMASVGAFGEGGFGTQRLESQSFRALQGQQRQAEDIQGRVEAAGAQVQTAFPRADQKKLISATESFSETLATEDFNKAIGEFVSGTQKRKLEELKAGTARLRAENVKAARLTRPTASPGGKNVVAGLVNKIKDLQSKINQSPSVIKNIESKTASLARSDLMGKSEVIQARIAQNLQKLKTVPNDIKFAKQKINGLEKLLADANQEIQTIGLEGGTSAQEFTRRMQQINADVDELRLEFDTAIADSIADAEALANQIDPEPEKGPSALERFGGILKRGAQAVTGFLPEGTPDAQAEPPGGTQGFGQQGQQQGPGAVVGDAAGQPEGKTAFNKKTGQTLKVVNGKWVVQ